MSKSTQRTLAVAAAAALLAWFTLRTSSWLASYDTVAAAVADSWQTVASNGMLVVMLSDAFLLFLLIFFWLARDARSRGWVGLRRWLWIAAVMFLGCPALLIYLAFRPEKINHARS